MQLARIGQDFAEVAVDAEADAAGCFLRLEVHVGCPLAHRVEDDAFERLDQGVVLHQQRQLFFRPLADVEQVGALEVTEALFDSLFGAIVDGDGAFDLAWQGENRADPHLGDLTDPPYEIDVRRRCHRDGEYPVEDIEADRLYLFGDLDREVQDRFVGDDRGKRIDVSDVQRIRPKAAGVILGKDFAVDDRFDQERA